ncbi:TPA: sel1 repeat family protein [Vibrio parahaemolyticus]|nr:sel1 repeat family protein [Vibrio parahaemolyticus]HBH7854425.1 sel1 repeat family protein [Vibrio parahaemolyticus]
MLKVVILSICASISFGGLAQPVYSSLDPEKAFEIGEQLHRQFKDKQAMKYLKFAADNGSASGAFLYGTLRQPLMSTARKNDESYFFIRKAAEQGYLPALKWLYQHDIDSPQHHDWRRRYYSALIFLGQSQPDKAFYLLADYYRHSDKERYSFYLSEAVKRKYPKALIEQAQRLDSGEGGYIVPSLKQERVASLYLQAAETKNIPAMRAYIEWLEIHQHFTDAYHWRIKSLQAGDILSLVELGLIYSQPKPNYKFIDMDYSTSSLLLNKYINEAGDERFKGLYKKAQVVLNRNGKTCLNDPMQCKEPKDKIKRAMDKHFLY